SGGEEQQHVARELLQRETGTDAAQKAGGLDPPDRYVLEFDVVALVKGDDVHDCILARGTHLQHPQDVDGRSAVLVERVRCNKKYSHHSGPSRPRARLSTCRRFSVSSQPMWAAISSAAAATIAFAGGPVAASAQRRSTTSRR